MAYTTINKSTDYFNTKIYTGDGTTGQSITGVGFQPDLCWIKSRSAAQEHMWYDAVRGVDKLLRSNGTYADATTSTTTYFTSFDSDGFTVGSETALGGTGASLVAWNWLGANGTASNTDGSITSTVSDNTTSGFSIVSYTGTGANATVGHGLSSTPKMMIIKNRSGTQGWGTYHHTLGSANYLDLSSTVSSQPGSGIFNSTNPTSSVFSIGTSGWTNDSGNNYIAYCFAEKTGYSKFDSYTGNGNADGPFIYTGFKPAFVITKSYSGYAGYWTTHDSTRNTSNVSTMAALWPNAADAESNAYGFDLLSNGFKIRTTSATLNQSSASYIYMAFAEAPLVGTNNVPANAR
jgi:hypothetical protein